MWVVYSLLGLLAAVVALLLLLLFVPVWVRVSYRDELYVRLRVLGIPVTVLPAKEDETTPKKKAVTKKPKPSKGRALKRELTEAFREDGPGATLAYLQELARLAGTGVKRLLRSITVDRLQLELLLATGEPADTAITYGRVCGVLYPALAAINGPVQIKKKDVRIEPNFLLDASTVSFDVHLHVRVFQALGAATGLLWRYMMLKEPTTEIKEEQNNG